MIKNVNKKKTFILFFDKILLKNDSNFSSIFASFETSTWMGSGVQNQYWISEMNWVQMSHCGMYGNKKAEKYACYAKNGSNTFPTTS